MGDTGSARTSDVTYVEVEPGPLAGTVLARVAAALAVRAGLPIDRLSDAAMIADSIGVHAGRHTVNGRVSAALAVDGDTLLLAVGPLVADGADAVRREASLPAVGSVIDMLADAVRSERDGGGERLVLEIRPGRTQGGPAGRFPPGRPGETRARGEDAAARTTGEDAMGTEHRSGGTGMGAGWAGQLDLEGLHGCQVVDTAGDRIGRVEGVYVDDPGDVRYLAVATGWYGTRRAMIPVDDTRVEESGGERVVVLPYRADDLRSAPAYEDDEAFTAERERAVYGHYGRRGYSEVVDERQSTPAPTPEIAEADAAAGTREARRAGDVAARQTEPAPTPRIAEAEVEDALRRGDDPRAVRVRRWRP